MIDEEAKHVLKEEEDCIKEEEDCSDEEKPKTFKEKATNHSSPACLMSDSGKFDVHDPRSENYENMRSSDEEEQKAKAPSTPCPLSRSSKKEIPVSAFTETADKKKTLNSSETKELIPIKKSGPLKEGVGESTCKSSIECKEGHFD